MKEILRPSIEESHAKELLNTHRDYLRLLRQQQQYIHGWVAVEDVCSACEVPERLLRADGRRRPIFARFAISSSTHGLKHLSLTTAPERIRYKHSRLKVLIANRRALDEFHQAVHACLTGRRPNQVERHTGQMVFL